MNYAQTVPFLIGLYNSDFFNAMCTQLSFILMFLYMPCNTHAYILIVGLSVIVFQQFVRCMRRIRNILLFCCIFNATTSTVQKYVIVLQAL